MSPEMFVDPIEEKPEIPSLRRLREADDANLMEYLAELAGDVPIKITVVRKVPRVWAGRTIEGQLDTFEEPISQDMIREMYGGGTYEIKISRQDSKDGKWKYATKRTLKIAGDPRLDGLITTGEADKRAVEDAPSAVNNAMRLAGDLANKADARAARAEERAMRQPGPDPALLMFRDELSGLRQTLAEKDDRIFQLLSAKPDNTTTDVVLGKMLDNESSQMTGLRAQIESERVVINARHDATIDRLSAQHDAQLHRTEEAHRRELDSINRSNDAQMTMMKISYEGQMDGFKREIQHLASQLDTAQVELVTLRQLKNKSPVETITELAALREAFEGFTGGKDEGGGTAERIINGIMGSPIVEGIGSRLSLGAGAAAMAAQPPQQPQQGELDLSGMEIDKPVKTPDGRILVKRRDGQVYQVRRKAPAPTPTGEGTVHIDPAELAQAIKFLEGAATNDVDPAQFVASARSLVPPSILQAIRSQGVDHFLANVAKLDEGSILNTQHGRNWIKKVASILLG